MKKVALFTIIIAIISLTVASCTASRGGRSAGCYSNKGMVGYH
jgi:hypothetical protein